MYDAEQVELAGGSGVDSFTVTATAAATKLVKIGTGAGQDVIQIGAATAPLTQIHGQIDVRQTAAEDVLRVYSGSTAGATLSGTMTSTSVAGLGLADELWLNRLGQLGLFLGSANENLTISSLPQLVDTLVQVNLGAGDDTLRLGGADSGGVADLSRLSGFTLGMTGGAGNDALVLDDHQSSIVRNAVLITDVNVQNLGFTQITTADFESLDVRLNDQGNQVTVWKMARPVTVTSGLGNDTFQISSVTAGAEWPLVIQAGGGADVLNVGDAAAGHDTIAATIRFYGGSGNEQVNVYDLDDGGRLEANGEAGADTFYLDYLAGGQAVLDGGDGADVLQVGWTAEYHTIAADISFFGRAGDDRAGGYQLRSDGSLRFDGGDDNDELNLERTVGEVSRLDYLDGPVVFEGGLGVDRFDLDAGSNGGELTLATAIPPGGTAALAWAAWEATAGGLFWAAESGTISVGGASNLVHLQATAPECQTLAITAAGDSEFRIEAQAGTTLDDLHGQITLTDPGYDDWLRIDNRASARPLRAQLTEAVFQTLDAFGAVRASVTYSGLDGMDVYLGDASDTLTVGSVRAFAAPVVFSLGGGDDLLEVGREGSLSRLSAIYTALNIYAGDGRDTVAFYDADNPQMRSVTFSASTIDGLLPFAAQLGYVEQVNAYLGARDDELFVANPNWDLRVDTGGGTDTMHVNLLAAGKTAQVLGGPGDDDLYVGDGTTAAIPAGTIEFYGGDGNDEAYVYRAPSTAVFNYYGEGGDDKLVSGVAQPPGTDPTKRLLGLLDGAVCFDGGDGSDTLTLQQTIGGNVTARFHQSPAPNGSVLGHLTGLDMDQGLWYDAESVSLNMGNTLVATDQTEVYIDATGSSTQLLEVARLGGIGAHFHVGTDTAVPLSALHGQLKLSGGGSLLEVSEAGVHDGADALSVSWNGDAAVRRGLVTSRWFPGVNHQGMTTIQITATDAADTITVQSLQTPSVAVALLSVQTTDVVVLGQSIGSSHLVTVNGVKPIYALPTAADNASGSMSALEGATLNAAVSIRDVLADRELATLVTDHGTLVNPTAGNWQYLVAGALLQTIGFTATDTAGYQTRKLFNLAATNVAPVANSDVYSVREQKLLSGNVLANDTNYNDHPTVRAISNPSHGTLTLAADGSFAYTLTAGFVGDDTFTYQVNDGAVDSNLATVTIHVTANHAPVAAEDTLAKRLYLSIRPQDILGNDTDADGDALSVVILSPPTYGALVENGDGTWRYVPERWMEEWSVSFTYAASDGLVQSAPATVTLTPLTNARPEAMEDRLGTLIDSARVITAADLLANDSDADGDALGVIIQSQPEHGTLVPNGTGAWLYQPAEGFFGWDTFLYSATDGMEQSLDTSVRIQVAPLLPAHTLAVNGAMSTPSGPLAGRTWGDAYNSLQDALDRAAALNADADADNDITAIWMAAGTYAPSRRRDSAEAQSESFALLSGVSLYGGFEGVEATFAERPTDEWFQTILSGEVQDDGDEFNNAWTVVYADQVQEVVLDRLTISDAYGWDGDSFEQLDRWLGGGVYAASSTLTLRNVNVVGNLAVGGGGGIYQAGGVLRLENVALEDNATWQAGGGLSHVAGELYVSDTVVRRNRAEGGGGLYLAGGTVSLVRVLIGGGAAMEVGDGNSGGERGGGAWLAAPLTARMTNVTIDGNQAPVGGGVYLGPTTDLGSVTLTVTNGRLADNLAYNTGGGAVYNEGGMLTVHNTTISRNEGAAGAGVFSDPAGGATTTLFNSVIAENSNNQGDVWGTFSAASAANLIGVAVATTGLTHGVQGNLVGTPDEPFAAGLDRGLDLMDDSPAIAAGDTSLLPWDVDDLDGDGATAEGLPLDAAGRPRISGRGLNMGAYQQSLADAGGPYTVDEGGSIELTGWAPFDPPVVYRWDLQGLGSYGTDAVFSAEWIDGPAEQTVWMQATNDLGLVGGDSATIVIRNVAPQVAAGPDVSHLLPDAVVSFAGQITDPGRLDTHTVHWDFGDGTMQDGTLTPSHRYAGRGNYTVTLTVTDHDGGVGSDTLDVVVDNAPPVLGAVPDAVSLAEGVPYSFTATATAASVPTQTVTFSLVNGPAGASIDPVHGVFTWTPSETQGPGVYPFTVRVTDSGSPPASDERQLTITVTEVNAPPVLTPIGNRMVNELSLLSLTVAATDADLPANPLTYSASGLPAGASFDPATRQFRWTPTEAQGPGVYPNVVFSVSDGVASDSKTITLTVKEINDPPVLESIAGQTVAENSPLLFTAVARDAEAGPLTYSLDVAPAGATIAPDTGVFSWTPLDGPDTVSITVRVTDHGTPPRSDSKTFTVTVTNLAPMVDAGANQTVAEGSTVRLALATFTDAGMADTHSATIDWGDGTVSVGTVGQAAGSGAVSGSHAYADDGTYTVTVTVTDDAGDSHSDTFLVAVGNVAPVVDAGPDQTANEGDTITLAWAAFTDAGTADTHTATIDWGDGTVRVGTVTQAAGSGTVLGSHAYADDGTYTVTVTVTDNDGGSHANTVTLTVNNVAPKELQLSLSPAEIDENGSIALSGLFTDPGILDAHTVTIDWDDGGAVETRNLPAGTTNFSGISHTFGVHRPPAESYAIRVTVSDGLESATKTLSAIWPWADFGDAPDSYGTLWASNGARHRFGSGLFLGAAVDADRSGQPTVDALGDDAHDADDEDGVAFGPILRQGRTATVRVTASQAGRLDAFLDFNADGDFADAGERIFNSLAVAAGDNDLTFLVPADAVTAVTYARFRLSSAGGLSFDGLAADGEVEDYRVTVGLWSVCTRVADGRYRVDVYNSTPGGVVSFVYGTETGAWPLPQYGLTLGITNPTYFALGGTTNSAGHSAAVLRIPSSLSGHTLYVQAFEQAPDPQAAPVCILDQTAPAVTLSRASAQLERSGQSPVHFTVTFSEPVTDFAAEDVTLSGTAPGTLTTEVSGDGTTYDVAVAGMTGSGTVVVSVAAGVAHDAEGIPNSEATGQDNFVVFLANSWQNYPNPYDVSGDGTVTAFDVLLVVNWLNAQISGPLPPDPGPLPACVDVDGNGLATPLDALLVINRLNLAPQAAGEGEAVNAAGTLSAGEWPSLEGRMISVPMPELVRWPVPSLVRPLRSMLPHEAPAAVSLEERGRVPLWRGSGRHAPDSLRGLAWHGASADETYPALIGLDGILSDLAEDVLRSREHGLAS